MKDRYEEALNTAKAWYHNTSVSDIAKGMLRKIFPELEERDEKIRKALIAYFQIAYFQKFPYDSLKDAGINAKDAIAWLEKQGEQKPDDSVGPKFRVGDWVMYKNGACFSDGSISARVRGIEGHKVWLEHGMYVDESELKK